MGKRDGDRTICRSNSGVTTESSTLSTTKRMPYVLISLVCSVYTVEPTTMRARARYDDCLKVVPKAMRSMMQL